MLKGAVRRSARDHASSHAGEASERMAADLLARARHVAEESEAGQGVERPSVDLRKVDPARRGARERRDSGLRIGRHAEIARQQVHGAERQHAEHLVAAGERRNRGTDAAVAAPDDDGIVRSDRRIGDRPAQRARLQHAHIEPLAMRLQRGFDLIDHAGRADVDQRAGARIEQNQDLPHPRGQLNIRSPCWSTIWRALASENSTASS